MKAVRYVRTLSTLTLIFVYLVILAGSIVRASGSGMGCPDWPKCFGQWIPPTDISQLPNDYEQAFLDKRKAKLDKFCSLLEMCGMSETASALRHDENVLRAEPFNVTGTWVEYLNRLVGFVSGNLMLLLFLATLFIVRSKPWWTVLAFSALILLTFQAWLGAVVVTTNLTPWVITIHMMFAFVLIALLISLRNRTNGGSSKWKMYRPLMLLAVFVTLIQVFLGTQVRQQVDHLLDQFVSRHELIASLNDTFDLHRSFSILVLLVNGFLIYRYWNVSIWRLLGGLILLEVMFGVVLANLDMPQFAQPMHLLLATAIFGVQWWIYSDRRKIPI